MKRVMMCLAVITLHCGLDLADAAQLKQVGWLQDEALGSVWLRLVLGPLSMFGGEPTGPSGTKFEGVVIAVACMTVFGFWCRYGGKLALTLAMVAYAVWWMCGASSVWGGYY